MVEVIRTHESRIVFFEASVLSNNFCEELGSDPLNLSVQLLVWKRHEDLPSHSLIPQLRVLSRKDEVLELSLADLPVKIFVHATEEYLEFESSVLDRAIYKKVLHVSFINEPLPLGVEPVEEGSGCE